MKKITLILITLFLNIEPIFADGGTGFGSPDCGQWISQPDSISYKAWLVGYMSGLNQMYSLDGNKGDPLERINSINQMFLWMNNYCTKNPLNRVSSGGVEMFIELMKKLK